MKSIEETTQFQETKYLSKFWLFTDFLIRESQQKLFVEKYYHKPWNIAIANYQSVVTKLIAQPQTIPESKWQDIVQVLLNWQTAISPTDYNVLAQCLALGKNYQQALFYWEKVGYPEPSLNPKDLQKYYLVKAKLTPLPQALGYLVKAKKYLPIIQLWFGHGKNQDSSWLKYVAIAYEAINHFESALIIYCHLDQPDRVAACGTKLFAISPQPKYLKKILSYYLKQHYWNLAIALVEKYRQVNYFAYFFLYSLGKSQLSPSKLNQSERQKYQQFIQQNILHNTDWQKYFIPQSLGIILEKIGSFLATFSFYEQYTNSSNAELRQFSRYRWLATKQQQTSYFQATNQIAKVKKAQQELTQFAQKWHINLATVSLAIPAIRFKPTSKQQTNNTSWKITGLPSQVRLKTIAHRVYQFQLHHLTVRLIPTSQQIAIADTLSAKIVRWDGRVKKLQIDTTTINLLNNQQVSLEAALGDYSLTIIQDNHWRWELTFLNSSIKIRIEVEKCS